MSESKAQHTPGPWTCGGGYVSASGRIDWDISVKPIGPPSAERGMIPYIATTRGLQGTTEGERKANAFLIEAAPELLDICRELYTWGTDPDRYGGDLADLASRARVAIAKAEGRT